MPIKTDARTMRPRGGILPKVTQEHRSLRPTGTGFQGFCCHLSSPSTSTHLLALPTPSVPAPLHKPSSSSASAQTQHTSLSEAVVPALCGPRISPLRAELGQACVTRGRCCCSRPSPRGGRPVPCSWPGGTCLGLAPQRQQAGEGRLGVGAHGHLSPVSAAWRGAPSPAAWPPP